MCQVANERYPQEEEHKDRYRKVSMFTLAGRCWFRPRISEVLTIPEPVRTCVKLTHVQLSRSAQLSEASD